jgi:hypothetical protein
MRTRPLLAAAAIALALAGPSLGTSPYAHLVKKGPAKSQPAAATRTVTLDITGME